MSNEVSKREELPSYLTTHGAEGAEERLEIQTTTPRLKVIQSMTDRDIKKEFGEGALLCMPDQILVAGAGEPVVAIPIFRWVSWQTWLDINEGGDEPTPVLAESFDAAGDIAARSRNPNEREGVDGEGRRVSHRECIHFIFRIDEGPAEGVVAVYSWMRAGHKHGAKLARYTDRQGANGVGIYANRIRLGTMEETNAKNQTYHVLAAKPDEVAYVAEERLDALREQYLFFADLHKTHAIRTAGDN